MIYLHVIISYQLKEGEDIAGDIQIMLTIYRLTCQSLDCSIALGVGASGSRQMVDRSTLHDKT